MRFYHGTRVGLTVGTLIHPNGSAHVSLTPTLDAAIWEAEIGDGDGSGRVYVVEPTGAIEDVSDLPGQKPPGRPWMSWRSREPLRVLEEVTEWRYFHGTRSDIKVGSLILPGHSANYGKKLRHVYLTRTMDAATWGAELAVGEGRGRIYIVEPTGPIEDDPNVTNKRFRGNPTKSFRSLEPLRVIGEVAEWIGHSPEAIKAMKDGLERIKATGVDLIED